MQVNSTEGEELKVLFHAAKLGRTDIIQSVITSLKKQQKDFNTSEFISSIDNDGNTSLHIASHSGRSDVVRALLNFGGDPSILPTKGEFTGKTAYEVAFDGVAQTFHVYTFEQIALGHLESLKLLLKGKVPIDLCDDSATKDSTLHWACSFDQYLVAEFLLQQQINVDITNAIGQSCLHIACKSGKNNFIDLLLDHGANTSLKDSSGKTPIDLYPSNLPPNPRLLQNDNNNNNLGNVIINEKSTIVKSQSSVNNNNNNIENNNNNQQQQQQNISSTSSSKNNLKIDVTHQKIDQKAEKDDFNSNNDKNHDGNLNLNGNLNDDSDSGYDTDTSDEFKLNHIRNLKRSKDLLNNENKTPIKQLILWPPVQRQIQYPSDLNSNSSLVFSSDTPIIISATTDDIDIYPLLTWSGLIDTLTNLGLQSYVHRSTTFGKIRFTIDPILCPGRHRYEITIDSSEANLIASDSTGLLYAVHTFVQIIQLHSDFVTSADSNINTIIIPRMKIIDWPDVLNRGILWSYRKTARTTSSSMKSLIRLYSALRINQLFLLIDSKDSKDSKDLNHSKDSKDSINLSQSENSQFISSKVCSLDEISKRHFVELIPVVTISHLEEKLPVDVLRNFSHHSIAIVLNLSIELSQELWTDKYRQLLLESLSSGHRYVLLVSNDLFKDFHQIIQRISLEIGIYVQHYTPQIFFPSRYLLKTLTSSQHMAVHALAQAKDVYEHGSTLSIYPAMSESDFLYPNLLYKHVSYLHAGASWNRNAFEEILGNGLLDDHSMLRPSLKFFLFSQTGNHEEERLRDMILDLLTTQFTNGISCTTFEDVARVENFLWSFLSSSQYPNDIVIPFSKEEIIECLKTFRSILTAVGWKANSQSHSRNENNHNSNTIQRNHKNTGGSNNEISNSSHSNSTTSNSVSTSSNLHLNSSSSYSNSNNDVQSSLFKESEEFLHILHLISILCRCFILAWNSYDKIHQQSHLLSNSNPQNNHNHNHNNNHNHNHELLTIDSLISCLTPGSASDVANMILEGVTVCYHHIWQKKFESFHVRHGFHSLNQSSSSSSTTLSFQLYKSNDETEEHHNHNHNHNHHQHHHSNKNIIRKAGKYLRNLDNRRYSQITKIELPFRCVFQNICKHMPNYSIDVLHQVFDGQITSDINQSTTITPIPSPQSQQQSTQSSSWSIWKR